MGLIDDIRLDIGYNGVTPSGVGIFLSSLTNDLRINIGDDDVAIVSGVSGVPGVISDLRTNIGDDGVICVSGVVLTSGVVGDISVDIGYEFIDGIFPTGVTMGIINDLRIDVGDDSGLIPDVEVCSPQVWCVTVVTSKNYTRQPDETILLVNTPLGGPTIINIGTGIAIGQVIVVKDRKGDADINPIIVRPPIGSDIDGFVEFQITQRFQSFTFSYNGTGWNAI